MRAVWQFAVSAWLLGTSSAAFAIDPMMADLKARLAKADADVVNAHLDDHFDTKVTRLRHLILRCDPEALSLAVSLGRHPSKTVNHIEKNNAFHNCAEPIMISLDLLYRFKHVQICNVLHACNGSGV